MVAVDIWVGGIADQKFLADVMKSWLGFTFDKKFKYIDESLKIAIQIRKGEGLSNFNSEKGWGNIKPFFEENNLKRVKNLIVADADVDFVARKNEIGATVQGVGFDVETDLFLWPDNQAHPEKGDLERLLAQIVHPDHKVVLNCFENYENCLRGISGKSYAIPNRKAQMYAYTEALGAPKKEHERDYTNPKHWDITPTSFPLNHLYHFLTVHLTSSSH
jgi:hypothetical protein